MIQLGKDSCVYLSMYTFFCWLHKQTGPLSYLKQSTTPKTYDVLNHTTSDVQFFF